MSELLFEITSFKRSYEGTLMSNEPNQTSHLYHLEHSSLSTGSVFRTRQQHRTLIHARNRQAIGGCSRITFILRTVVRSTDYLVIAMSSQKGCKCVRQFAFRQVVYML
jgi:hypothetical protein